MSYPMDLDEYSDEMIRREAAKRAELLSQGHCTYCRQHWSTPRVASLNAIVAPGAQ